MLLVSLSGTAGALATSVLVFAAGAHAVAAPVSGTIDVSASISANCTIATSPLNFGNYDPIVVNRTADLQGSTPIVVTCTKGTTPILQVGAFNTTVISSNTPNAVGSSKMTLQYSSNGAGLNYTFSLGSPVITTGISTPTTWPLNGTVPAGQDQAVGVYLDTLYATANF